MILYRHVCKHCGFQFWTVHVGQVFHCPNCGELQCEALAAEHFEKRYDVDKETAEELCGLLK